MAEIAGVSAESIRAWSQRSTQLREWAANNLQVVEGPLSAAQLATAQKATRPAKPEELSWAQLQQQWRADARGLHLDRAPHLEARAARRRDPAPTAASVYRRAVLRSTPASEPTLRRPAPNIHTRNISRTSITETSRNIKRTSTLHIDRCGSDPIQ